jgi:dihydropteroate synthase
MEPAQIWQVGPGRALQLDQPRLIGILNVTPDSFSDGGANATVTEAVDHGVSLLSQGACMIDVGGESTRPGAGRVEAAEQIDRTVPVIEALRRRSDTLISIDTTRAAVAEAALDAGADVINDVSAGTEDAGIFELASRRGCGLILMHRRVPPDQDLYSDRYLDPPEYDDVVVAVGDWLALRCRSAEDRGVDPASIVIDPGLGFGKSVEQNFELIRRTGEFVATGRPVLGAASRKSFIGAVSGVTEPGDRDVGSATGSVLQWLAGVRLFRVHDVAVHRQAIAVAAAAGGVPAPV